LIGFVVAVFVPIALLLTGLSNVRDVYGTTASVTHTEAVKSSLERLLGTVLDAETGERGFVITGDEQYLEPYDQARASFSPNLARTRALTADNREHQVDLDRLSELAGQKFAELADVVTLRRQAGVSAATTRVANNVGKQLMDEMRFIVGRMKAREDALLATRTIAAAQRYRAAQVTQIVGAAVGVLAVIGLFIGTIRHGTDRLRAARALQVKHADLQAALNLKDEFVAVVSHELRQPTSTIVGWARMLDTQALKPENTHKAIAAIRRSADSLRQLIDDLMDTSQLVAGRMRLAIESVDLIAVINEAIESVRLSADNKGVVVTNTIAADRPIVIQGDAGRLKQVVWNLMSNAIKFTPSGGHVTISLHSIDRGVRIEVSDTGVGIAPDFLPHVFDRFAQGMTKQRGLGIGLGLAIVRHLVELHGGTVVARSAGNGLGATFVVTLPLAGGEAAADSDWSAA